MALSSPGIEALKREARGRCIACDGSLPPLRRVVCADPDCWRMYLQVYGIDRRAGYLARKKREARS